MRDGKKKEKRKHVTDTGERYREALKYSFILVRGGSMSGLAYDMCYQFHNYKKRLYANKTRLIFSWILNGFHLLSVKEQLMTIYVSVPGSVSEFAT